MRARLVFTTLLSATIAFGAAGATVCPSDVNGDGTVDVADFLQLLSEWGCTGCASDIDGSGVVDVGDFLQLLADWGCQVTANGEPTLSGTVTNLWTTDPIVGATVTVGVDVLVTDDLGAYAGAIAPGTYDVVFEAEYFTSQTVQIELVEGVPMVLDAQLVPTAAVVVNVVVNDVGDPGGTVDVMADVVVLDGSTILSYAWSQLGGTPAAIGGADTDTATLTLGTQYEYKEQLFHVLAEPPITADQLPPNVPLPPEPFPGGLQDRFEVAAPNPFALEEAGLVDMLVDVTTTSGTYSGEGEVHAHLPWKPVTGVRNVPVDSPVLLHGKDQASYDWAMTVPNPGTAVLVDATTQYPEFTPDWPGLYEVTVTDIAAGSSVTLEIYAGNWRGAITGQDLDGRPVADSSCTGCHAALGVDKFTPWKDTGHAEIFTDNLNTSTHYGDGCFSCHAVGYDPDADNNGFDEASDYQEFMASGLLNNPSPDNWGNVLKFYPYTALQANIQCENCHGPQWGLLGFTNDAHQQSDPRTSISSDVCGSCHGEPLRHARFQQWQLSAHANYELAIDEGDSGSCSRCHTGNGFLTWLPILLGQEPGDPTDDITVTWTSDEVHPQTCATCHDPHAIGTQSGEPNNATVRISGDTPMLIAGFQATDVGRGAICMTCHNSRRGLRNDSTWDDYAGTSEAARAPHGSAQTDVVMGENAYLVEVGIRGNHSLVEDSCAACHMVETPPPDDLSYNSGGTNHTFYASTDVCSSCHGPSINAEVIQSTTRLLAEDLQDLIEQGLYDLIAEQIGLGYVIDLDGDAQITDPAEIVEIVFGESRGRQAITVTLVGDLTFGPYGLNSVDVLQPDDPNPPIVVGALYEFASAELLKAGWNYGLVHNDGSGGIHNPSFAFGALVAGIDALDPPGAAAIQRPWWVDEVYLPVGPAGPAAGH